MSNKDLIERLKEGAKFEWLDWDIEENGTLMLEAATALEAQEWRTDMENAPKDGSMILAIGKRHTALTIICWHDGLSKWAKSTMNNETVIAIEDPILWKAITMPEIVK